MNHWSCQVIWSQCISHKLMSYLIQFANWSNDRNIYFYHFFLPYSLQTHLFPLWIYPSPSSCLGSYAVYQPRCAFSYPQFSNKPKITHYTATLEKHSLGTYRPRRRKWNQREPAGPADLWTGNISVIPEEMLTKGETINLCLWTVQQTLQLLLEKLSSAPLAGRQKPQLKQERKCQKINKCSSELCSGQRETEGKTGF